MYGTFGHSYSVTVALLLFCALQVKLLSLLLLYPNLQHRPDPARRSHDVQVGSPEGDPPG